MKDLQNIITGSPALAVYVGLKLFDKEAMDKKGVYPKS